MIKKSDIRGALKAHHDAVTKLKQGLLANNADGVANALDAANCAWEQVEKLLAAKYPDHIELVDEEEVEEEEDLDVDETEEEEEEGEEEEEEEEDDD